MNPFVTPDFLPAAPEMILAAMACLVLVVDVYLPERYRLLTYQLAQAAVVLTSVACIALYPGDPVSTFNGTFVHDRMGSVLKLSVLLVGYFAFFYAKVYLVERKAFKGEYFVLGLFSMLGMLVLISAGSLLTAYLGLELMSLCLYAMVALDRDAVRSAEAAMKYFVLGALASGMLLYGMSLLYGVTGTLDLAAINASIAADRDLDVILVLGLVFVLVGVAFKLGAVPFHMWVPDVYHGAPTATTLFIGTAPKIAAFGMLMRLLVEGLGELAGDWRDMLVVLAVLSMAVGNVIAIAQTNLKRMLAYSTISHVGFLLLGIIAGTSAGYGASMFYIIVYALMGLGAFGMIIVLGREGFESDEITDFRGLNGRSPWLAFLTLVVMLSMAGVPPFVGFWAKWSVLRELVASDMTWLAVVAVLFAIIGLFYYLRVIRMVYFEAPDRDERIRTSPDQQVVISTNALAILALGIYPSGLLALCAATMGG